MGCGGSPRTYLDPVGVIFAVADIFIPKQRPFDRAQLERRTLQVVATDPERTAYIASAEDTILAKLDWYRQGGQVSERQWRDVLGVLRVQDNTLDMNYLRSQATALGVADLLEQAVRQATADSH